MLPTALLRKMVAGEGLNQACLISGTHSKALPSSPARTRKQTVQLMYICLRVQLTPQVSPYIQRRILLISQDLREQGCLKRSYFSLVITSQICLAN